MVGTLSKGAYSLCGPKNPAQLRALLNLSIANANRLAQADALVSVLGYLALIIVLVGESAKGFNFRCRFSVL